MRSLFDTNVLSFYVQTRASTRSPNAVKLIDDALSTVGFCISSFTAYELRRGVRKLRMRGEGRRKEVAVERLLDAAQIISPDAQGGATWRVAAELWAEAEVQGIKIGESDLLIAATAMAHKMRLMTNDVKLIANLKKLSYEAPIRSLAWSSEEH